MPAVGRDLARDEAEERGFAGAVRRDERHALTQRRAVNVTPSKSLSAP